MNWSLKRAQMGLQNGATAMENSMEVLQKN